MSGPASLGVEGALGLLRLVGGLLLLAAPGLAAVDRFIGLGRKAWMFASVFALTLLPLTAILLDFTLQVPVSAPMTALYAIAWTVVFEWPRRRQILGLLRSASAWRPARPTGWTRKGLLRLAAVLVVLGGVAAAHSVPHLPGGGSASAWTAYPDLAQRVVGGLTGHDYPYAIHVDEHYHLAHQAAIEREGHIAIKDPYTGGTFPAPLFSVSGFRDERGFDLALVQVHELTGLSLAAQARFVPAAEAAILAGVLYAALWPAPGALASAALVSIIPTTVRFLGPGFLVPSAFALPWIVTAMHVSLRAQGGRRLAALGLLETAAFFLHLVMGTLVLATAAGASLARPGRRVDRVALAAVCFLPLLWIGPLVVDQVVQAISFNGSLPFQPAVLLSAGAAVMLAAAGGGALAVLRPDDSVRPHRVLLALGLGVTASLLLSIRFGHHSDATYSRLVPTFFLCVAGLAGLGLAGLARLALHLRQPMAVPIALALLVLVAAAPAVAEHLDTPDYRVFDADSWHDASVLASTHVQASDLLLCDPWRAPMYNTVSGLHVYAVLLPGAVPAKGDDWGHYLDSHGANATWLQQRGITVVVAPFAPNAPHVALGGNVYRLNATKSP